MSKSNTTYPEAESWLGNAGEAAEARARYDRLIEIQRMNALARYNAGQLPPLDQQPLFGQQGDAADVRALVDRQARDRSARIMAARAARQEPPPPQQPPLGEPGDAADVRAFVDGRARDRSAEIMAARAARQDPGPPSQPLLGDAAASASVRENRDQYASKYASPEARDRRASARSLREWARELGTEVGTPDEWLDPRAQMPVTSSEELARDRRLLERGTAVAMGLPGAEDRRFDNLDVDVFGPRPTRRFTSLDDADRLELIRRKAQGNFLYPMAQGFTFNAMDELVGTAAASAAVAGIGGRRAGNGWREIADDDRAMFDAKQRAYAADYPYRSAIANGIGAAANAYLMPPLAPAHAARIGGSIVNAMANAAVSGFTGGLGKGDTFPERFGNAATDMGINAGLGAPFGAAGYYAGRRLGPHGAEVRGLPTTTRGLYGAISNRMARRPQSDETAALGNELGIGSLRPGAGQDPVYPTMPTAPAPVRATGLQDHLARRAPTEAERDRTNRIFGALLSGVQAPMADAIVSGISPEPSSAQQPPMQGMFSSAGDPTMTDIRRMRPRPSREQMPTDEMWRVVPRPGGTW